MNVEHFSIFVFTAFLTSVMVSGAGSRALLFPVWSVTVNYANHPSAQPPFSSNLLYSLFTKASAGLARKFCAIGVKCSDFSFNLITTIALTEPNRLTVRVHSCLSNNDKSAKPLTCQVKHSGLVCEWNFPPRVFDNKTSARLDSVFVRLEIACCSNRFVPAIALTQPIHFTITSFRGFFGDHNNFSKTLTGKVNPIRTITAAGLHSIFSRSYIISGTYKLFSAVTPANPKRTVPVGV